MREKRVIGTHRTKLEMPAKREKVGLVQINYRCFHGLPGLTRISLRATHITFYAWAMKNQETTGARMEAVSGFASLVLHARDTALSAPRVEAERPALRKPHRLWMTGSFAVVMAALGPAQDRITPKRVFRQSPYSVGETMQRLGAEARQQGLSVLAELDGTQPMLVLGSSIGGTPVVMDRANSRPHVPLSVGVRERAGGGVEVLLAQAAAERDTDWDDLPSEVAQDLAALPRWVDRALS